ncbi:MAG: acyltransferase family protein [Gulosibacter sp.]|uniref:acyltransferase family protein n=1 Tax=Gulosibacter sp. TaxID=2817531 RepID=UPI003F8E73A6
MSVTSEIIRESNAPAATRKQSGSSFRPDIQGLRAIAVGVVLLYHAGVPLFGGGFIGVDVFFVISGFLITGGLLRSSLETGRIHLADFYAKRVRRIIPAATVVLAFTALATLAILPVTRWQDIGNEIIGSAFYFANWVFASSTNYLDAENAASPVQHFWTLSVEEQFYIVWPLIMIAGLWFARKAGRRNGADVPDGARIRRYLEIGVWIVIIPSLAWSIYETATNPAPAYFVTSTRLWELGIGAAIAIYAPTLEQIGDRLGHLLGVFGLGAILLASVWFTATTPPFPGAAALLPTLGAAAVIIGGMRGRATQGVGSLLSLRPMRWIGDLSYSLYLWHWPLIVLGTFLFGGSINPWQGLMIVAISFLPAWLSYRYIEVPFRNWELLKRRLHSALQLGLAFMLAAALLGAMLIAIPHQQAVAAADAAGAEVLVDDPDAAEPNDQAAAFAPSLAEVDEDLPRIYADDCHESSENAVANPCVYGDPDGDTTVALVGDSHAAQWFPALEQIAADEGWRLVIYTKSSCPLVDTPLLDGEDRTNTGCVDWNERVQEELTENAKPDHVIVSSYGYTPAEKESFADGLAGAWQPLLNADIELTVLVDPPAAGVNVPECVATNLSSLSNCTLPQHSGNAGGAEAQLEAAEEVAVPTVDMSEMVCPREECSPIIGEVLTYRDQHHLTATYVETLKNPLADALREQTSLPFDA